MTDEARRTRILVLNQYYWPGIEATAQLLSQLCEALATEHDVTVVTGRLRGHDDLPDDEVRNGVRIVRVRSTSYDRAQLHLRAANYLSYLGDTILTALRGEQPDLVLCMTDPPVVGDIGLLVARRFGVPLLVISQDVFPEIAERLKRLESRVVVTALRQLVGAYLRRADRVVAIGDTMKLRLVEKGADPARIEVIPNWVDTTELTPHPRANAWSHERGLDDAFVVMHSGNVGHAQDLETLVRAAALVQDLERVVIVIVGFGARHRALSELADELGAANVRFFPYQPREALSESLSTADVHYVGLASGLAGYVVPSRINGILSAGRPVIVAADAESETAQLVGAAECGVVVPPGDAAAVAHAIRRAYEGDVDLDALGAAGRAWIERHRGREAAISRYRGLLDELSGVGNRQAR